MKNVRELETYGAILIGCGIMAYTLMLASVDAPVWATIEFVMGTLFMVVGVWCVYLAGMEYDYQMEKRRYRQRRGKHLADHNRYPGGVRSVKS